VKFHRKKFQPRTQALRSDARTFPFFSRQKCLLATAILLTSGKIKDGGSFEENLQIKELNLNRVFTPS
jgi:hypothetical protein